MDQDKITFLRDICKKVKEIAEISDRFLALEAAKKESANSSPLPKEEKASKNRLIPLSHWNEYHDWPSINALRGYDAFMRHRSGFDKVMSKVGRRLVIDEEKFFEWVCTNPKTLSPEPTPLSKLRVAVSRCTVPLQTYPLGSDLLQQQLAEKADLATFF